jgi:hypothetical protein
MVLHGKVPEGVLDSELEILCRRGVLATTTSLETLRNTLTRRHSRVREPFNFTWREGDRTLWRVRHGTISSRMGGRWQRNALRKVREDIRWGHPELFATFTEPFFFFFLHATQLSLPIKLLIPFNSVKNYPADHEQTGSILRWVLLDS